MSAVPWLEAVVSEFGRAAAGVKWPATAADRKPRKPIISETDQASLFAASDSE
ncbi:MAG: hypothetical protein LBM66_03595 [Bifidobacteriaceae bacterium]|jgi:hypothetical protein|nr:hypothetical protein [Bifidobacteriaceae bacterium]